MFRWIFISFVFLNCSCVSQKPVQREISVFEVKSENGLGCLQLTNQYCKSLYDPSALGNLQVVRPKGKIAIRQGETENNFSHVFFQYSHAKIRRQKDLPPVLQRALEEQSYFSKLRKLLARPPLKAMTYPERIQYDRLFQEVDRIWNSALDETIMRRLIAKFKGFHQIGSKEMPPEYEIEAQKEKRRLLNQVSLALWKEDQNWRKVEETFENLKDAYLKVIQSLDAPEALKNDYRDRILTVRLLLPGSLPEIADYQCSSTTVNAYYYKYLNIITVCAGDFNSEDILQTLAHEMGHALDISRSAYLFKMKTQLAKSQKALRHQVCERKNLDCSQWQSFKDNYSAQLAEFSQFQPELKEFNQCLKRRTNAKVPSASDFERMAQNQATSIYSSLAGADYFLRIIKEKLPLRNGKLVPNPYHLNPCKYYLWTQEEEPPEDAINSLVYFTAEFRCQAKGEPNTFKNAIEVSKKMTEQIWQKTLELEGEFSDNDLMISESFSAPPDERYSDVLASHAMAEFLKGVPSVADRRGKVLASVSWLCSEPSLKSQFPEESKIENDYSTDSHTDGILRFQEILAAPVRESLQCQKDFEFKECQLPQKLVPVHFSDFSGSLEPSKQLKIE